MGKIIQRASENRSEVFTVDLYIRLLMKKNLTGATTYLATDGPAHIKIHCCPRIANSLYASIV